MNKLWDLFGCDKVSDGLTITSDGKVVGKYDEGSAIHS